MKAGLRLSTCTHKRGEKEEKREGGREGMRHVPILN